MYANFVKNFPWINLMIVAELMFLALFLGALVWVFRRGSKQFYQKLSQLPLEEGNRYE